MRFHLGTHQTDWLARTDVPLFISHRRLAQRRRLPKALGPWSLDSGGFTELADYGHWETTPQRYADAIGAYHDRIGRLAWAAPQDWMCEPFMLAKTGKTIAEHQARTIESFMWLNATVYGVHIIPVLQGWHLDDYLAHVDQYAAAGIDLTRETLVGVGSVCRRQSTTEIADIFSTLARRGIALHGFGVKTLGLGDYGRHLASADSMAWSYNARHHPPIAGHTHRSCANCIVWALRWRERVLAGASKPQQLTIWDAA